MQMLAMLLVSLNVQAAPLDGLPLPAPSTPQSLASTVVGWKANETPKAPKGFSVTKFTEALKKPRWVYQDPKSSDLFFAESEQGRITLFRDANGDGTYESHSTFINGLDRPFGMLIHNGFFYIANVDGLWRYPYTTRSLKLSSRGKKLLSLPAGLHNHHWTRNLLLSKDGKRIYIAVGSGSNVAEYGLKNEVRRANILSVDLDGKDEKILASGLRNPVGMDFSSDGQLWTVVNERDLLGDELVPDYLTSVQEGGFYGWPYSYFGQYEDPRMKGQRPDLVSRAIVPDVALGAHTASLGLAFYKGDRFPAKYRGGAFIGQHGSWNRSTLTGYAVKFVPFDENGKPSAPPEDFLTGFIVDAKAGRVRGRPVGVTILHDGSMLIVDDGASVVWQVRAL
jgi:glucose/arabinose dehydrogenase